VAPNIAALARESVLFTQARTNAGHTDLATVALFYGIHPYLTSSKAEDLRKGHGGAPFHLLVKARGFSVAILSGDWEQQTRGYAPLFPDRCDLFLDARTAPNQPEVVAWSGLREDIIVSRFCQWYPRALERGPFLAYLKFIRPHQPYYTPDDAPRPFVPAATRWSITDFHPGRSRAREVLNRYDNAVHWVDAQVGRVVDDLRASGAWEDTAVVLLSDHGEAWGEHALYGHAMQHFEEFLSVPLLVRVPGVAPRVDRRQVSSVDVAPTILDILGAPPHPTHEGHSLLDTTYEPEEFFALSNTANALATLHVGPWKFTESLISGERWLFHMERDPKERENVAWDEAHVDTSRRMHRRLRRRMSDQLGRMEALRQTPTTELIPKPK
jgi:arylsulfatase A-like enzyme